MHYHSTKKELFMLDKNVQAIVLAAGKSSRLKSGHNKMLEKICGQEMILFPIKMLEHLAIETTVVVGFEKESIMECIQSIHPQHMRFAEQTTQAGTGDAVRCTSATWHKDHILILNGDMPLITPEILQELYHNHTTSNAAISFVMAHNSEPSSSYGRVIQNNGLVQIIEAREFTGDVHEHCCINAGIYLINRTFLEEHIDKLATNTASNELHITDLVSLASKQGLHIATTLAPFDCIRGVNNQHELWAAEQVQRGNLIKYWMERGVRFSVAQNVHIDLDVTIGVGTYIGCGVHLLRGSSIGQYCIIDEYVTIEQCTLGNNSHILPMSVLKNSALGNHVVAGPFAHIHNNCTIGDDAVIGNFVEITRSTVGTQTKAKHLTYLGDAQIGNAVNIGAGTITCNFDGKNKHATTIESHAFIGSNNTLVAPVHIEQGAFTAAGSTITEHVPADALAIARSRQLNKHLYARRLRDRHQPVTLITTPHEDKQAPRFTGAVKTVHDTMHLDDQQ
jgi:bifunctional UDP-N-acetylglucosamine pyrophosphorylase/glucosamine-1-phosphate N-acetyltransferase